MEKNAKTDSPANSEKHWENVYKQLDDTQLGWYEKVPGPSLRLIKQCDLEKSAVILNVGAGTTTLIDKLIENEFENIIATDISRFALEKLKKRLKTHANKVKWVVDDLIHPTRLVHIGKVDLWHDRAVLHFFNDPLEQEGYFQLLRRLVKIGGFVIITVFHLEGAKMCSNLPVFRYNEKMLQQKLGKSFKLIETFNDCYTTPSGNERKYVYTLFERKG